MMQCRTTETAIQSTLPPRSLPICPFIHMTIRSNVNQAVSRSRLQSLEVGSSACRAALGAWQAREPNSNHCKRGRGRARLFTTYDVRLRVGLEEDWAGDATINISIPREVGMIQYRTTDRLTAHLTPPVSIRSSIHIAIGIDVNQAMSRPPIRPLTFGSSACRAALGAW